MFLGFEDIAFLERRAQRSEDRNREIERKTKVGRRFKKREGEMTMKA